MLSLLWDMQGWIGHASSSRVCYDMLVKHHFCIMDIISQSGSLISFVSQLPLYFIGSLLMSLDFLLGYSERLAAAGEVVVIGAVAFGDSHHFLLYFWLL